MEQTIIEFFAKSSELILHNRILTAKTLESALNQITNPTPSKFQLNFDQKFNFTTKIPSQWNTQNNKLLVLEFFLCLKSTRENILIEQWIFELNQVSDNKLKYTIDSQSTLYKKLSVLLRTISLLTVTLPLYRSFISDKSNPLWEYFTLEHSIHFTRHNLSGWHSSVYEEKNQVSYTNPDLVLPGRNFAFKVSYPKSLLFLQNIVDVSIAQAQTPKNLSASKEKGDMDPFRSQKRDRLFSEEISHIAAHSMRKSTSDSNKVNVSSSSPREPLRLGVEGISENASPFGSLLASSPIETQRSPTLMSENRPRKSSGGYFPWDQNRNSGGSRPRFKTINSESSGEYEMYIYEDTDGKFTEVLEGKEVDDRVESPTRFSIHPKTSEDAILSGLSRKLSSMQDLKLSTNAKPIEKIIEQTDDDKIAEIIKVVEELKEYYYLTFGEGKGDSKKFSMRNEKKMENSCGGGVRKGFKFQLLGDTAVESSNKNMLTLSSDYELFGNLYSKLKKEN